VAIVQTARVSTPLRELVCGDDPSAWRALGFAVSGDGACSLGPLTLRLRGGGGGVTSWVLGGEAGPEAIDGIATSWRAGDLPDGSPPHPNGVTGVDHVVVLTDSRDRTVAALRDAGSDLRRCAGPPGLPAPMAFVRMGDVIVEVAENGQPSHVWGLTVVVPDVDALSARYPDALGAPRDAVQPGRRIVTARGLDTALAFITPRAGS
jgi:hypothetical protein